MKKVNLVLSGGGARGVIHLGVYKYLKENDYEIVQVAGTSAGSLVGCLIAAGCSPQDILKLMTSPEIKNFMKASPWRRMSLFNLRGLRKLLLRIIPHNSFEGLTIPLTVCSTNLNTKKAHYLRSGDLVKSVIASCSIPIVFEPQYIDGELHADGGLTDNLPVKGLIKNDYPVIAVNVNNYRLNPLKRMGDIAERIVNIAVANTVEYGLEHADYVINPSLYGVFPTLDLKSAKELVIIGYDEADEQLG
ncbi:patatin-like phospholipase family protein [Flavobacteriaceae bacterium]|nr:patatin-like phospholipase family protein [Flavobacteriaceae bacterium]